MNKKDTDNKLIQKVYNDLRFSAEAMAGLHKAIIEDFNFEQGKQWEDSDISTLENRGIKALTINKIKPIIKLITGIERQSRTDYKALPEGGEDVITADIINRLIKSIVKNSKVDVKMSEIFKNGSIGGMCFIEPYMDYTQDLLNGDLKFKKISSTNVFFDPRFQEYDLSDSKFLIKLTTDLSEDELIALFPDKEKAIKDMHGAKIDISSLSTMVASPESDDYPAPSQKEFIKPDKNEITYDLIDYYYKELKTKYYAIIPERGVVKEFDTEEGAQRLVDKIGGSIINRKVPVIMLAQAVGNILLYNDIAPFYPLWRGYPIIPFFAELITEDLVDYSLKIQGVVRGIKDLNLEYNKRRTQELNHINTSINSGFIYEEGTFSKDEEAKIKERGASPGVAIKTRNGKSGTFARITPMPLSQGHSQLAIENAQDLKEASGVNPDLLANDSQSQSGRAILFKQRQGLQMIQETLDNFGETKRLIGKFILSQIQELFTVETAMRVVGDAFIADNFTVPVTAIKDRALTKLQEGEDDKDDKDDKITELEKSVLLQYPQSPIGEPIVDENNNLVMTVDFDQAIKIINSILSNQNLNKYDIAIGEGPFAETVRMANFTDLKELASQGVPIPPQSLIETSMLPQAQKNKILKQLAAMAQTSQAQQAQ